jgi:hypothetical protein
MKLIWNLVAITCLSSMSLSANADVDSARLLAMVHKAGFTGCDTAILKEFDDYLKSPTGRISGDYFKKGGRTYSLMATWGKPRDSIFQHTTFEKDGDTCNTYQVSMIDNDENCMAYKEQNPVWKYVESTGDYMWTKNAGNVDALMQTTRGGSCNVVYQINKTYPADK